MFLAARTADTVVRPYKCKRKSPCICRAIPFTHTHTFTIADQTFAVRESRLAKMVLPVRSAESAAAEMTAPQVYLREDCPATT
jgi:hypothetical protein